MLAYCSFLRRGQSPNICRKVIDTYVIVGGNENFTSANSECQVSDTGDFRETREGPQKRGVEMGAWAPWCDSVLYSGSVLFQREELTHSFKNFSSPLPWVFSRPSKSRVTLHQVLGKGRPPLQAWRVL